MATDIQTNFDEISPTAHQLGQTNIAIMRRAWTAWFDKDIEKYLSYVHEDFEGEIMSSIIPGGHNIKGKYAFKEFLTGGFSSPRGSEKSPHKMRHVKLLEPRDFGYSESGQTVFYHVDYDMELNVGPYKGERWHTTANVAETFKDGKIWKKMHIVNKPGIHGVPLQEEPKHAFKHPIIPDKALMQKNITMVKNCCVRDLHPDFEAWFGSGIIPGGDYIGGGPEDFEKFMDECSNAFQRTPVEYKEYGVSENGNVVYWKTNWDVIWKTGPYAGQHWQTTGIDRKHLKDGLIWRDFNIVNVPKDVSEEIFERG